MVPFYEIPKDAWLFRSAAEKRGPADRRWTEAEEHVRQWCLHELIRAYGVSVRDLEIERPIRVARERHPHRADIVVSQAGKPYIVVECKSVRVKNLAAAMHQATNYASQSDVRATFAACTNGTTWLVRRRIGDEWIAVSDIPDLRIPQANSEWRKILFAVTYLTPLLHWLDGPVPARHAAKYFGAMQVFLHAQNELTEATDRKLLWAADNLLRVLSDVTDDPGYTDGKMAAACDGLNQFWLARGVTAHFGGGALWIMAHDAYAELSMHLEDERKQATVDLAVMRLILSLLAYLNGLHSMRSVRYEDVTDDVQREVRAYIDMALILRFNAGLPDTLDKMSVRDIQDSCQPAWEHFLSSSDRIGLSVWQVLAAMVAQMFRRENGRKHQHGN